MEPVTTPVTRVEWGEVLTVSQLLVKFAESDESPVSPTDLDTPPGNHGLIIPDKGCSQLRVVQKDGPKDKRAVPPVMSLRTLDGGLYVFDNGTMVEKGYFEYQHISVDMTSFLRIGPDNPALDYTDDAGTKLIKHWEKSTPTSESVHLMSKKFGDTLALEYSDDPENTHARLVLLPEHELKSIMKKIEERAKMIFKVNPVIKIRQLNAAEKRDISESHGSTSPEDSAGNNIALYFETARFYYYLHVNNDENPPQLELQRVDRTPAYDPHQDFIRHLQFTERPATHLGDDIDGARLDSIPEKNGEANSDSSELEDDFKDLTLFNRSQSDSSVSASKPSSLDLQMVSSLHSSRDRLSEIEADTSNDSLHLTDGKDETKKQIIDSESPASEEDLGHNGTSTEPITNGTASKFGNTGVCSSVDATVE